MMQEFLASNQVNPITSNALMDQMGKMMQALGEKHLGQTKTEVGYESIEDRVFLDDFINSGDLIPDIPESEEDQSINPLRSQIGQQQQAETPTVGQSRPDSWISSITPGDLNSRFEAMDHADMRTYMLTLVETNNHQEIQAIGKCQSVKADEWKLNLAKVAYRMLSNP